MVRDGFFFIFIRTSVLYSLMNDLNKIINTPLFQIRNIFDLNWKKIQNSNAVGNFLMISNLTVDSTCTLKFKFRSHDKNCNMNLTESSMKSYFSKF